jgi:hypothetical protein
MEENNGYVVFKFYGSAEPVFVNVYEVYGHDSEEKIRRLCGLTGRYDQKVCRTGLPG